MTGKPESRTAQNEAGSLVLLETSYVADTVGEFGIAVRSGLENPDYRSVKTLLLPIDGTFQFRLMNSPTVSVAVKE